jgi:hypothetical protein
VHPRAQRRPEAPTRLSASEDGPRRRVPRVTRGPSVDRRLGRALGALLVLLSALVLGTTGPAGAAARAGVPDFSHVVVIVMENKEFSDVVGRADAPTFARLARRYASLTGYFGVAHPSLPNYLALVSGSTHGIDSDCTDCVVDGPSLAGLLGASGRTWKTYAEGLPAAGSLVPGAGRYALKHDPFLYFTSVRGSPAQRRRVVPLTELRRDLATGSLPGFSLVVPDLCHDMHDCPVATGDAWLAGFLPPLLASPEMRGGVVFVVFDEGTTDLRGGGHIPALVLGPTVRPGARSAQITNHYGLLRTIEDAWALPHLGASAAARPIGGIWRSGG